MPREVVTASVTLEMNAGPLSDWMELGRPKRGMISLIRNSATTPADSDEVGKASIHPEKVSTRGRSEGSARKSTTSQMMLTMNRTRLSICFGL